MLSNGNKPNTISVIIPAYNSEKYIKRCLDSVLGQTRQADEIILVDDGSTDGTAQIIKGYGEKVKYIYQENAGSGAARNKGIETALCEWIAFLDSDDQWLDKKLQVQIEHLQRNPDLMWSYGNFYRAFGEEKNLAHKDEKIKRHLTSQERFADYLTAYSNGLYTWTGTLIVKREVFDKLGLFRTDYPSGQDTDMWFRIAFDRPQVGYVNQPLAVYNLATPGSNTSTLPQAKLVLDQIDSLLELSRKQQRFDQFKPCVVKLIYHFMGRFLDAGCKGDVIKILAHFKEVLTLRFRAEMRLRAEFPRFGTAVFNAYDAMKRLVR